MDESTTTEAHADIEARLARLEELAEETRAGVNTIRRYLAWTFYVTLIVVGLPLLFLPYAINKFVNSYSSALLDAGQL